MRADWIERKATRRDELINLARYGEITPDEAEAEAMAAGLEPFARKPELPAFDPMAESRWTITMAIAWMAWRDLSIVRDHAPGIREDWWHWIFREWNEPIDGGKSFARRKGWFLENRPEATTMWLMLSEAIIGAGIEESASIQMTIKDAREALWQSLAQSELVAEGLNEQGRPIDIPARDWSYLKLYEDGRRDVLKFGPLDRIEPYSQVKLRRDDLLRLWPPVKADTKVDDVSDWPIDQTMLQPLLSPGSAGYVPLCAALHWIMTGGGARATTINDQSGWQDSSEQLRALIAGGEIEMIGLPRGRGLAERFPAQAMAIIRILPPLANTLEQIVLDAPSHISCTPYVNAEHWHKDFNDQLFERGTAGATWSHLQVRKSEILSRWPRPEPKANAETECLRWLQTLIAESPENRPRSRETLKAEAMQRFAPLSARQFERAWIRAIGDNKKHPWSKAGRPARKSNHRTK